MATSRFSNVYLLHGKGGWPGGSVLQLQEIIQTTLPEVRYVRPMMPHGRDLGQQKAEVSVDFLRELQIETGALVVGVSLGGLVAAKLQEEGRADLHVICISSPTWADGVRLGTKMANRLALYSSHDDVIAGRTAEWPELAEAQDLAWLSHDTDRHKVELAGLLIPRMQLAGQ